MEDKGLCGHASLLFPKASAHHRWWHLLLLKRMRYGGECSCVTPTILCWLKQILQRGKHTKNFLTVSLYQIVQHAPLLESLYGHWNWCRSGEREIRSLFTTLLRIPVGAQPPLFSEFVDFFFFSFFLFNVKSNWKSLWNRMSACSLYLENH